MQNKNLKGLAHIGIFTTDMESTMAFYKDILGMEISYQKDLVRPNGTTKLGFVQAGSLILEFIQPADIDGIQDKKGGIVDHIAIEVKDIEELAGRLMAQGVAFETSDVAEVGDLFNGIKNIFFSGPNGERLEFFEYLA